jgi:hypothetical protein
MFINLTLITNCDFFLIKKMLPKLPTMLFYEQIIGESKPYVTYFSTMSNNFINFALVK